MADSDSSREDNRKSLLSPEQEAVLEMYITHLDTFLEDLQEAEKLQVKIETLHLRKILGK